MMSGEAVSVLVVGSDHKQMRTYASALSREFPIHSTANYEEPGPGDIDTDILVVVGELPEGSRKYADATREPTTIAIVDDEELDRSAEKDLEQCVPLSAPPSSLVPTITRIARQITYDRKLEDCLSLAQAYAERRGSSRDSREGSVIRSELAAVKSELDELLSEYSDEDFNRAFQRLSS